jgi:hypothetical protein
MKQKTNSFQQFNLTASQKADLNRYALQRGRSVSSLIRDILIKHKIINKNSEK